MPYDETFPSETPDAPVAPPETPPTAPEAPDPATDQSAAPEATSVDNATDAGSPAADDYNPNDGEENSDDAAEEAPEEAPATPAFDEKAYLKQHFGDDAPDTAAELRTRLDALRSTARSAEDEGRAALLQDPAKLAAFAKLAGTNYDTMDAAAAMREKFALDYADMPPAMQARRFAAQFATQYPTLAAYHDDPESVDADDPALLAEQEEADYDARAARTALKTNQTTQTGELLAAARAGAASTAGPTPEQQAFATAALAWTDENIKDGFTLPVDVGNGQVIKLPVGDTASFKESFANTDALYRAQVVMPDGKPNAAKQALIAHFLKSPEGFVAALANAVKASLPPSLAIDELTNARPRRATAAKGAGASTTTAGYEPDGWQNSNI